MKIGDTITIGWTHYGEGRSIDFEVIGAVSHPGARPSYDDPGWGPEFEIVKVTVDDKRFPIVNGQSVPAVWLSDTDREGIDNALTQKAAKGQIDEREPRPTY